MEKPIFANSVQVIPFSEADLDILDLVPRLALGPTLTLHPSSFLPFQYLTELAWDKLQLIQKRS